MRHLTNITKIKCSLFACTIIFISSICDGGNIGHSPFWRERTSRLSLCQPTDDLRLPITHNYLQKISRRIFTCNPTIFRGFYQTSDFCIKVALDGDADSRGYRGEVILGPPKLLAAESDAEVAFVLAHEFGHILNRGDDGGVTRPWRLVNNAEYRKLLEQKNLLVVEYFRNLSQQLASISDALKNKQPKFAERIAQQRKSLNWMIAGMTSLQTSEETEASNLRIDADQMNLASFFEEVIRNCEEPGLSKNEELPTKLTTLRSADSLTPVNSELEALEQKLIGGENEINNEVEAEADITAFYLFLNAGFYPNAFQKSLYA